MKNLLLVCLVGLIVASCDHKSGSGNMVTRTEDVASFNKLKVSGAFYVEVVPNSAEQLVKVTADDNIIEDVLVSVEGEELEIKMRSGTNYNNVYPKVIINIATLEKITTAASAKVQVKNTLKSSGIVQFETSSAGTIIADVDAPTIDAQSSSGSTIELSGRTKNYDAQASSGSSIKSAELLSENTDVQTSSGASAKVHSSVTLKAKASSGGEISYKGAGAVSLKENSGGSVKKMN